MFTLHNVLLTGPLRRADDQTWLLLTINLSIIFGSVIKCQLFRYQKIVKCLFEIENIITISIVEGDFANMRIAERQTAFL